jgi:hypothetical protein
MATFKADQDNTWMLKDLIRAKFMQKIDGMEISDPKAFMESSEAQKAMDEAKADAEAFLGYSLETAQEEHEKESMAREIKYALKDDSGKSEMACDSPESIMD